MFLKVPPGFLVTCSVIRATGPLPRSLVSRTVNRSGGTVRLCRLATPVRMMAQQMPWVLGSLGPCSGSSGDANRIVRRVKGTSCRNPRPRARTRLRQRVWGPPRRQQRPGHHSPSCTPPHCLHPGRSSRPCTGPPFLRTGGREFGGGRCGP